MGFGFISFEMQKKNFFIGRKIIVVRLAPLKNKLQKYFLTKNVYVVDSGQRRNEPHFGSKHAQKL